MAAQFALDLSGLVLDMTNFATFTGSANEKAHRRKFPSGVAWLSSPVAMPRRLRRGHRPAAPSICSRRMSA